jgi:hypothetical protein
VSAAHAPHYPKCVSSAGHWQPRSWKPTTSLTSRARPLHCNSSHKNHGAIFSNRSRIECKTRAQPRKPVTSLLHHRLTSRQQNHPSATYLTYHPLFPSSFNILHIYRLGPTRDSSRSARPNRQTGPRRTDLNLTPTPRRAFAALDRPKRQNVRPRRR